MTQLITMISLLTLVGSNVSRQKGPVSGLAVKQQQRSGSWVSGSAALLLLPAWWLHLADLKQSSNGAHLGCRMQDRSVWGMLLHTTQENKSICKGMLPDALGTMRRACAKAVAASSELPRAIL